MARFEYIARDHSGKSLTGEIAAVSAIEAARLLRADGKFVIKLKEAATAIDPNQVQVALGRKRVSRDEVIHFASQLAIMVDTGVSLTEAITGIIEESPPGAMKRVLSDLLTQLEGGREFSAALARHPKAFTPLFVNLVKAAEASGTLGPMLLRCGQYLTDERDTRKRVRGAMMYPALLMLMCIGVTIFLMTYLLPKFTGIYAGKEEALPTPTKILIAVSNGLTDWAIVWVPSVLLVLGTAFFYLRNRRGRKSAHWLVLNLPILGSMYHKSLLTRCLRTLGTLVDSGVSMLDSVAITQNVVGNHYYEQMWDRVINRLHRGDQLTAALRNDRLVPRSTLQMLQAGERSGQLGTVLSRIGEHLEEELRAAIKTATAMIEPLMIFVMGAIVGGIAIALLLPIFTISRVLTQH